MAGLLLTSLRHFKEDPGILEIVDFWICYPNDG
jgi:hypothetical protein